MTHVHKFTQKKSFYYLKNCNNTLYLFTYTYNYRFCKVSTRLIINITLNEGLWDKVKNHNNLILLPLIYIWMLQRGNQL